MTEQTHERALDELARGLASGSLLRPKILYTTAGYREVYESGSNGTLRETEPSRGGNQCLNQYLVGQ